MFGRRRRYHGGGGGFGLLLMALQFIPFVQFLSRSNEYYPATLGLMALNVLAYFRPNAFISSKTWHWPTPQSACMSVQTVWFQKEWKRLFYAPFVHADEWHLYYNMASFMWKAVSLEKRFGTAYFLYMMAVFTMATNLLYLGINMALAEVLDTWSYVTSCAVGFSGVIFAVKVVTTHLQPHGMTYVMGMFPVPMRLACWAELLLISLLFPNVSFVGHLSGILVGLAFVSGPLRTLMDAPLSLLTPNLPNGDSNHRRYTYRAEPSGFHHPDAAGQSEPGARGGRRQGASGHGGEQQGHPTHSSYAYAYGTTGYRQAPPARPSAPSLSEHQQQLSEDEDLQEAIERSLCDNRRPGNNTNTNNSTAHMPPPPPPLAPTAVPSGRGMGTRATEDTTDIAIQPQSHVTQSIYPNLQEALHAPAPTPHSRDLTPPPPPFNPHFSPVSAHHHHNHHSGLPSSTVPRAQRVQHEFECDQQHLPHAAARPQDGDERGSPGDIFSCETVPVASQELQQQQQQAAGDSSEEHLASISPATTSAEHERRRRRGSREGLRKRTHNTSSSVGGGDWGNSNGALSSESSQPVARDASTYVYDSMRNQPSSNSTRSQYGNSGSENTRCPRAPKIGWNVIDAGGGDASDEHNNTADLRGSRERGGGGRGGGGLSREQLREARLRHLTKK